ncbi:uncharacterized protein LOC119583233 [Penaeus monodon]|uniref:uncharacterized protein LOC119583233 n=1 Tax=Penaeus monodon TaxID=6687 RepID=UPI0018A779BF|nr:uncharacterized protein LOC119583233 [Penaeus monodon]
MATPTTSKKQEKKETRVKFQELELQHQEQVGVSNSIIETVTKELDLNRDGVNSLEQLVDVVIRKSIIVLGDSAYKMGDTSIPLESPKKKKGHNVKVHKKGHFQPRGTKEGDNKDGKRGGKGREERPSHNPDNSEYGEEEKPEEGKTHQNKKKKK